MKGIGEKWAWCLAVLSAVAAGNGALRGVVHDPQHRPLAGARVVLHGPSAALTNTVLSDANGEFQVSGIAEGIYTVTVSAPGFAPLARQVTVTAGAAPVLHFQLELAGVSSSVEVSGAASKLDGQASTVQTMVSSPEITHAAGADQTNSLAMITDFTPGAYMVHDMLHMRGGHQVNWFFDGIPVVNTNIAANVAPLINPKNVAELEIERGGFFERIRRSHLRILQCGDALRFRAQQRCRTDCVGRKLRFHRRSNQFRRSHRTFCLLPEL